MWLLCLHIAYAEPADREQAPAPAKSERSKPTVEQRGHVELFAGTGLRGNLTTIEAVFRSVRRADNFTELAVLHSSDRNGQLSFAGGLDLAVGLPVDVLVGGFARWELQTVKEDIAALRPPIPDLRVEVALGGRTKRFDLQLAAASDPMVSWKKVTDGRLRFGLRATPWFTVYALATFVQRQSIAVDRLALYVAIRM